MRYKVGDKVRVRKDLPENYTYNVDGHILDLKNKRSSLGKRATIIECHSNHYKLDIDDGNNYIDEMLEPVEDIIEYKGKKYDAISDGKSDKGIVYLKLKEHKEEILDETEKRYLSAVIKPFKNKVINIFKVHNMMGYFIVINTYGCLNNIELPEFEDKRMYKGMELDKEYTLEDLGL